MEFSYPKIDSHSWNGQRALMAGRLWASFDDGNLELERWYNAVVRWIRKRFLRNPIPLLEGYIGPAAFAWYQKGGFLLPAFRPPLTPEWLAWAEAQNQHRELFKTPH
jgi:hypothetical protein